MSIENYHFQRLLPYPESWLIKKLLKSPLFLYRLGLGKLFGNYILILSTTGRHTGNVHRTPVEYFFHEDRFYIISGFGEQPDWFQNIQSSPRVTVQNGYETLCVRARPPQTKAEWQAIELYLTHSPVGKLLQARFRDKIEDANTVEKIKGWPVLTFDPTDEPCPPPLMADLVWAWPLILLGAAIQVMCLWLLRLRKH
jgi:deazaflavin-dependent oxidoreductase (nitroreductase family)